MGGIPNAAAWTFVTTNIQPYNTFGNDRNLAYGGGLWCVVGEDTTVSGRHVIATSQNPADGWTRKVETSTAFGTPSLITWGGGNTWAFLSGARIIWTTDAWNSYTVSALTLTGRYSTLNFSDLGWDGTRWGIVRRNNNGNFDYDFHYATSISGSWTRASTPAGFSPVRCATNGERWVLGGWTSTSAGKMMVTTTDITGSSWDTPTTNISAPGTSLAYPLNVQWIPGIQEWAVAAQNSGGYQSLYYAAPDASSWSGVPSRPAQIQIVTAGNGYIVMRGLSGGGSNTQVLYYKTASSLGASGAYSAIPAGYNVNRNSGDGETLADVLFGEGVFVSVGHPTGQTTSGSATTPDQESGEGFWGVPLDDV